MNSPPCNLTHTEWLATARALAKEYSARFPAVGISTLDFGEPGATGTIIVKTPTCTGRCGLHHADSLSLRIRVQVSGGTAIVGEISEVEAALYEYRKVCDVLHALAARTSLIVVWLDGQCPCDTCRGTGSKILAKDSRCDRCGGKGKR